MITKNRKNVEIPKDRVVLIVRNKSDKENVIRMYHNSSYYSSMEIWIGGVIPHAFNNSDEEILGWYRRDRQCIHVKTKR